MTTVSNHKGWSSPSVGVFVPNVVTFQNKLEPGMYDVGHDQRLGIFLKRTALAEQSIFQLPNTLTTAVVSDIKNFWARKDLFRKYNFPYKRGILLQGPPGCGKSSTISLVCQEVTNLGGLVIKFNASHLFIGGMKLLKQVQPDVPVVALMEDLDEILRDNNISDILNLLDGVEKTIDNVVYLATTNNPERLHQNIKNRPSRFDRRFEFKEPGLEARKYYLAYLFQTGLTDGPAPGAELVALNERGDNDLDRWAADTEGFSFAHLKELFVSVVLFGNKYEEVISELGVMRKDLTEEEDIDEDDDDDDL